MKIASFYKKVKLFLLSLWLLGVPIISFAQIVPCSGPDCKLCHIFVLFGNLINFALFTIVPPLAVLALVAGGLMFYFSVGDPSRTTTAKNLIKSTITGILVVYFAGLIVGLIFVATGAADWERWWWGNISC